MPDDYEMSNISRILNSLLYEWDRSVEKHAAAGVDSSVLSEDMIIGRRLGWSESTVQTTRTVSFLTGASVVQMARSVSARRAVLRGNARRWISAEARAGSRLLSGHLS